MPQLPGSALALAGTGSVGSGVLGWFLRQVFSSQPLDPGICQIAVGRAVDAAQGACERAAESSEAFLHNTLSDLATNPTADKVRTFWLGVAVGVVLYPCLDILFILKAWWSRKVAHLLRPRTRSRYIIPSHYALQD